MHFAYRNNAPRRSHKHYNDCTSLTEINVEEGNANYTGVGGVLFNKDMTTLIQYPIGKTDTSYTVPDGVTAIGSFAFDDCTALATVIIPDSVIEIKYAAFNSCTALASFVVPDSVASVGEFAFFGGSALDSV